MPGASPSTTHSRPTLSGRGPRSRGRRALALARELIGPGGESVPGSTPATSGRHVGLLAELVRMQAPARVEALCSVLSHARLDRSVRAHPAWAELQRLAPTLDEIAALHEALTPDASGGHTPGSGRRARGVYYTPGWLVEHVLDLTLGDGGAAPAAETTSSGERRGAPGPRAGWTVCDPACGAGEFLLRAARRLAPDDEALRGVVHGQLHGVDIDPVAVDLCRLRLDALMRGTADPSALRRAILVGDALTSRPPERGPLAACGAGGGDRAFDRGGAPQGADGLDWAAAFPRVFATPDAGFDLVVTNPPFLGQLRALTATDRGRARRLAAWSNGVVKGYADMAAAFLLLSVRLARARGGHVGLVLPRSALATAHGAPVRAAVDRAAVLRAISTPSGRHFQACVHACAVALVTGAPGSDRPTVAVCAGTPEAPSARRADVPWSPHWASLPVVATLPRADYDAAGVVGDLAECSADFRDEYYALRGLVREAGQHESGATMAPLVTSGLIEPGRCAWGCRPARLLGRAYLRPCLGLEHLRGTPAPAPSAPGASVRAAWARRRLVPKVLLATQTLVLEALPDLAGRWLPVTPVISLALRPSFAGSGGERAAADPGAHRAALRLTAAVCSPLCTRLAVEWSAGAALAPEAIKLSARQAAALPLPADRDAWDRAVDRWPGASPHSARGSATDRWRQFALAIGEAYRIPPRANLELVGWWMARLERALRHAARPAPAVRATT